MKNKIENLLFVHDGPLVVSNNQFFGIAHNNSMFSRYLKLSDNVNIAIRVSCGNSKSIMNYSKIDTKKFKIHKLLSISNPKNFLNNYNENQRIITNLLENTDFLVIRLPSSLGFMAHKIAMKKNIPYMIELVTCPWDSYYNHSVLGKLVAPYFTYKTKKITKESKWVVYVTEKFLQNRYPSRYGGVAISNVYLKNVKYNKKSRENKNYEIINFKQKNSIIKFGTIGAIDVNFKGQDRVIKMIAILKKKYRLNNIYYELVGNGDRKSLVKTAKMYGVEDRIIFKGVLKHNAVFEWLESIHFYIQPSRQEGLPRALIEALSQGLPSFGANTAGIPELINSKYVFENTNRIAFEMAEAFINLDLKELNSMSSENYLRSQDFTYNKINAKRAKYYDEILQGIK